MLSKFFRISAAEHGLTPADYNVGGGPDLWNMH